MAKLAIFAGHGGSDPGACSNQYKEADCTLNLALKIKSILEGAGHSVIINRRSNVDSTIDEKVKMADNSKVDAVIEIHLNAGGGQGSEVYYSISGKGKELAENILDQLVEYGFKNRGVKTKRGNSGDYFGIIRRPDAQSVLVETCFIDSDSDMKMFNNDKISSAIATGILRSFGGSVKPDPDPEPETDEFISRTYQNGSTREYVFLTTAAALGTNESKGSIGYLDPHEKARCIGRFKACPVVVYNAKDSEKVGFVKWEGNISDRNYSLKVYQNGSTKEPIYSTVSDCKKGKKSIGYLEPWEKATAIAIIEGVTVVVYEVSDGYKVGFAKYSGSVK